MAMRWSSQYIVNFTSMNQFENKREIGCMAWKRAANRKGVAMLVLTRKVGESIHLGDDITVMVAEVGKGEVRIGITAPREVPVHREEIYRRILVGAVWKSEKR